ncbi:histone-fold-containing protein [Mucidula mucida]|nr:histone-fold-containing protein [Mucidula mucida]
MSSDTEGPFVQSGDHLNDFLRLFWQRQIDAAERETPDFRHPALPLARIKKVMKSDPDVKMIAADAPILFCKACEIFIAEVTARAFLVADANKRRTLSRADIAKALSKTDQFDFLIDIVPREELPFPTGGAAVGSSNVRRAVPATTNIAMVKHEHNPRPLAGMSLDPGTIAETSRGPHRSELEEFETLLNSRTMQERHGI